MVVVKTNVAAGINARLFIDYIVVGEQVMALSATHAKRDAIVLHASRGFASAPNSPRVFLQSSSSSATSRRTAGRTTATDLGPVFLPNRPTDAVEEILTRICSMFPTAREYDVRELLAK